MKKWKWPKSSGDQTKFGIFIQWSVIQLYKRNEVIIHLYINVLQQYINYNMDEPWQPYDKWSKVVTNTSSEQANP